MKKKQTISGPPESKTFNGLIRPPQFPPNNLYSSKKYNEIYLEMKKYSREVLRSIPKRNQKNDGAISLVISLSYEHNIHMRGWNT